nr:Uncharacterised protein [Raoultella sp. NCTC 9187]
MIPPAERIGDGLLQPCSLQTSKSVTVHAGSRDLESDHHKIRVHQRGFLVAMAANFSVSADRVHQLLHHDMHSSSRLRRYPSADMAISAPGVEKLAENIFNENR